jgi:hypothetical protein
MNSLASEHSKSRRKMAFLLRILNDKPHICFPGELKDMEAINY